jgi:hypothetical protein
MARQIGKVTWCILGDEDIGFFHSRASARLKSNKIKVVDHNGIRSFTHKEKEHILMNYYRDILGNSVVTQELIDLEKVYPNQIDVSTLTPPFIEEEIINALKLIPRDKSLGPYGFGSGFFQHFWRVIKSDILNLFHQFYEEGLQMDRNNRSYIVLIKRRMIPALPVHIDPFLS